MASATLYRVLVALNGCKGPKYFKCGVAATIYPGYVVTEDDADEIKVCGTTDKPFGVAGLPAYHDKDTAFAVDVRVPVYQLGSGVELYVLHDAVASDAVIKGMKIQSSDTTAGKVIIQEAYTAKTTTYNAAQFTERGDTSNFIIGRATETVSIVTGTEQWFKVILE